AVFILRDLAQNGESEALRGLLEVAKTNAEAYLILFEMAQKGDLKAIEAVGKLAELKYQAIGDLFSLGQKGNEEAKKTLRTIDPSAYRSVPGYDYDGVQALERLAQCGNGRAFEILAEMAEHYRPPVVALKNLAQKGSDRAVEILSMTSSRNLFSQM